MGKQRIRINQKGREFVVRSVKDVFRQHGYNENNEISWLKINRDSKLQAVIKDLTQDDRPAFFNFVADNAAIASKKYVKVVRELKEEEKRQGTAVEDLGTDVDFTEEHIAKSGKELRELSITRAMRYFDENTSG